MRQTEEAKVGIVGCGKVGLAVAYSILHRASVQELVLLGRDFEKVDGERLDLEHGLPFLSSTRVIATTQYADLVHSDIVIFSAGVGQKPGQTRLDLIRENQQLVEELVPQIVAAAPQAILVMVTNPVDILTYHAFRVSGLPSSQVLGSGTVLDSARLRMHLSKLTHVSPNSIHAYLLGEHGDSAVPILSSASIGGQRLLDFPGLTLELIEEAITDAKQAAYDIIAKKGSTSYAIGAVTSHLVETILKNKQSILPISTAMVEGYGFANCGLSLPAVLSRAGIEKVITVSLDQHEQEALQHTAQKLQEVYAQN